jgi:Zn-dependent M16 (insulinase) family peptidase
VPMDNTGVPHILEHTTLCGSEKYPCRDPFFSMLTRSLSTYMNAWTCEYETAYLQGPTCLSTHPPCLTMLSCCLDPDFTMYPFASQNAQDFSNLMAVYLDCVFFPKLTEMDFK